MNWYRDRLFTFQPKKYMMFLPEIVDKHRMNTKIVGAVTLCTTRPIDKIKPLQGNVVDKTKISLFNVRFYRECAFIYDYVIPIS